MITPGSRPLSAAAMLLWLLVAGPAAFPASGAAAAEEAKAPARTLERAYRVYYLDESGVDALVTEFCSGVDAPKCYHSVRPGQVRVTTTEEAHSDFAAWLKSRDVPPPTQVFHVHLFTADNAASPEEPIPAALAPVLKDLAGFLPFRAFHQVSTGMIRTSRQGRVDLGSEPHFVVDMRFAGDPAGDKPLQIESFELTRRQLVPAEGGAVTMASFDVLRTSFSMNVGETVVVGTSKLNGGDKALVVLLTAAK